VSRRRRRGRGKSHDKNSNISRVQRIFEKKDTVALIYEDQIKEGKRLAALEKLALANGDAE